MDRLLSVIQILVIVAIWLVAVGIIVSGLTLFTLGEGYGIHMKVLAPISIVIVGILIGILGTKQVKWIFNKE